MHGDRALTPPARRPWQDRIGGRWAVSWQGWLATAPVGILVYPLVEPGVTGAAAAVRWLVIAVVGWLALGAVALLADRTVLRRRSERPVAWPLVVLVGAVAGVARVIAVGLLAHAWDVGGGVTVASRILPGAVVGALWIVVTALIADTVADYRGRRRELVDRALSVHRDLLVQRQQARVLQEDLLTAVQDDLDRARSALPDPDAGGAAVPWDSAEVAAAIQAAAVSVVRPMSHRLDSAAHDLTLPRLRSREVVHQLVSAPLRALPVLVVIAAINLPVLARGFGLTVAVATLGCFTVLLATGTAAVRAQARPRRRFVMWLIAGVASAVLCAPVMLSLGMPIADVARWVIAAAVCVPIMQVATAIAFAVEPLQELSRERLEEFVDRQELERLVVERELVQMRSRVARFLHGSVQSGLLAAALTADGGSEHHATLALIRARDVLAPDLSAALRAPEPVPAADIARVAQAWQGLVDVAVTVTVPSGVVPAEVVMIVDEAIADAVRHGGAGAVEVEVRESDGDLTVSVADNGTPTDGTAGLGSMLLDRWARGQWSRQGSSRGGTVLRVRGPAGSASGSGSASG